MPSLLAAARAHRLRAVPQMLRSRHVDVYAFATRNVRLPIASLGLKDVAEYYGFKSSTDVSGGLEAQMLYLEYSRARSARKRKQLRDTLLAYNRDDLMALQGVIGRLRSL